jgi:hypothetical protein
MFETLRDSTMDSSSLIRLFALERSEVTLAELDAFSSAVSDSNLAFCRRAVMSSNRDSNSLIRVVAC